MKKLKINYNTYIKKYSHIRIYYFEEEIFGQILKESKDYILVHEIKDWHFDGYLIFPKKYIKEIEYKKIEKFREKLTNKKSTDVLDWLDISSLDEIFLSLEKNYNQICLESCLENVDEFILCKINKIKRNKIKVYKLSTYAKFSKKEYVVPKNDITCIFFGDEYSSKLFTKALE